MPNLNSNSLPLHGIRVLIPHFIEGSNYIEDLGKSYQALGAQVIYGRDNLFLQSVDVNLIHLNWPESIYRWAVTGSPEKKANEMIAALGEFKKKGVKIIWTVHNLCPHGYDDDPLDFSIYQQIIDLSDTIVHPCKESTILLNKKYQVPKTVSNIVSHGENYRSIANTITPSQARSILKISSDAFVYLQIGYIRPYKGVYRLIRAFWSVSSKKKMLLVAGAYQSVSNRSAVLDLMILKIISKLDQRIRIQPNWIENDNIQNYMNAASCVVIGNTSGLNSGIAGLAMRFGKLVIGPKLGCIPERLNQGENLIYENLVELVSCMQRATAMDLKTISEKNISASSKWTWSQMITQILNSTIFTSKKDFDRLL